MFRRFFTRKHRENHLDQFFWQRLGKLFQLMRALAQSQRLAVGSQVSSASATASQMDFEKPMTPPRQIALEIIRKKIKNILAIHGWLG
jgi:hypothetical protein